MFIETTGRGPDVVLLTGLPQQPDELRPLAEGLATTFRVHLVHLPGYGRSPAPALPYDFEAVEAQLAADLRAAGVERAALVGMSGGAYRALSLALSARLPIWAVATLGALGHVDEANAQALAAYAGALDAGMDLAAMAAERVYSPAYRAREPEAALAAMQALFGSLDRAVTAAELRAIIDAPDLRPHLHRLPVPVYLRVGALDLATPPALSEALLELLPDARLEQVEGVGHMLHHEDFEGTLSGLRTFLFQALTPAERELLVAKRLENTPRDAAALRRAVIALTKDLLGADYGSGFTLEDVGGTSVISWGDGEGETYARAVWLPFTGQPIGLEGTRWTPSWPDSIEACHRFTGVGTQVIEQHVDANPLFGDLYGKLGFVAQGRALLFDDRARFMAWIGAMSRRPISAEVLDEASRHVPALRAALLRADQLDGVPTHPEGHRYAFGRR